MIKKQLNPKTFTPTFIDSNAVGVRLSKINSTVIAIDTETHFVNSKDALIKYLTANNSPNNMPFIMTVSYNKKDNANEPCDLCFEVNDGNASHICKWLSNIPNHVYANAGFDIWVNHNAGISFDYDTIELHDVQIMHHLINEYDTNENGKQIRSLKDISCKYIQPDADYWEKLIDEHRATIAKERGISKNDVDYFSVYEAYKEDMIKYAAWDTRITLELYYLWYNKIFEDGLDKAYDINRNAIKAIHSIERRGYKVDNDSLKILKIVLSDKVKESEEAIYEVAGEFQINSSLELVERFESLGVDYHWRTEKGEYQTDEVVMHILAKNTNEKVSSLAASVLDYRFYSKMLNTYIANIEFFVQADGRVHPNFWLNGARTGRMSSDKPNFQNFPKSYKEIRKIFVPDKDYYLVFADYAQQEYKVLAHYSKERPLIAAIMKGYDVHKATAAQMFNVLYDDVTDEQRSAGKQFNFSSVYGLGLGAIASKLGKTIDEELYKYGNKVIQEFHWKPWAIPALDDAKSKINNYKKWDSAEKEKAIKAIEYYQSAECQEALAFAKAERKKYFANVPRIEEFLSVVKLTAEQRGYIKTWVGSRCRYPNKRDAYKAPNALIQGGCAYILKSKIIELEKLLRNCKSGMVNLVHDEVQFEIHKDELHLIPKIKQIMEDLPYFSLPITVDLEYSDTNWGEKKPIEELLNNGKQ